MHHLKTYLKTKIEACRFCRPKCHVQVRLYATTVYVECHGATLLFGVWSNGELLSASKLHADGQILFTQGSCFQLDKILLLISTPGMAPRSISRLDRISGCRYGRGSWACTPAATSSTGGPFRSRSWRPTRAGPAGCGCIRCTSGGHLQRRSDSSPPPFPPCFGLLRKKSLCF
jgi:hypothetical protein